MQNDRFVPTTDYDRQQLRTAMKEQNILLGKTIQGDGTHGTEGVPLIKKGGTRPPKDQQNSMASLLLGGVTDSSSKNKKSGVGNAAMGGVFKSIYLA